MAIDTLLLAEALVFADELDLEAGRLGQPLGSGAGLVAPVLGPGGSMAMNTHLQGSVDVFTDQAIAVDSVSESYDAFGDELGGFLPILVPK